MNDGFIVLHEACKQLTDDNDISKKLHDGYSYQLSKPDSKLYKGTKSVNKVKPKKTKSSQSEQEYITIEVITVKADEFYPWVVKQISKKKLPEAIRDNIPKKYTTHSLIAVDQVSACSNAVARVTVSWGSNNASNEYHYNFMIKEAIEAEQKISALEAENHELKARIVKLEKELAEAKPKAEKWDDWIKNKGRRRT